VSIQDILRYLRPFISKMENVEPSNALVNVVTLEDFPKAFNHSDGFLYQRNALVLGQISMLKKGYIGSCYYKCHKHLSLGCKTRLTLRLNGFRELVAEDPSVSHICHMILKENSKVI
jgi:hypothetical protein